MASTDYTEEELKLNEVKIEKNIPMRPRYPRGAFMEIAEKMEVGDSFYTEDSRIINGVMTSLNKSGRTIQTRTEGKGKRLWRTA